MNNKLSVGSWAFVVGQFTNNPIGIEEVARRIADLGYDGIALGGFKPHGSYELYPDKKARHNLVQLIHDKGLEINSYAPDLLDKQYYTGETLKLQAYREAFDKSLSFCSDCGIEVMRVDTVTMTPYPPDFDYKKARDLTVRLFREDAQKARDCNITIVWEFEPGRVFNKPSEIVDVVDEVNMDNFRIQYDTAHGQMCSVVGARQYGEKETLDGGQLELIRRVKGRIGDVHIIDNDNTLFDDKNSNKLPLGKGVIDLRAVISEIIDNGYAGEWWTLDLGPQRGDVWEICRNGRLFLQELFNSL